MTNSTIRFNAIDANILALVKDHRYQEGWYALRDLNPDAPKDSLLRTFGSLLDIAPNPL